MSTRPSLIGSLLGLRSPLRFLFCDPRFPRFPRCRIFAAKTDGLDLGIPNHLHAGLILRKYLQKRLRCIDITIRDIPFDRAAGNQFQRHVASIVEGLLHGFYQLGMRGRPEDATLERVGI